MNDLVKYEKNSDYEIIKQINYEIVNAVDYEELQAQLEYIESQKVNNICSIVSLILGIASNVTMLLSFCNIYIFIILVFFSGIEILAGIIFAIIALKRGENKVMSIFGIGSAILAVLLGLLLLLVYIFLFALMMQAEAYMY